MQVINFQQGTHESASIGSRLQVRTVSHLVMAYIQAYMKLQSMVSSATVLAGGMHFSHVRWWSYLSYAPDTF